MPVCVRELSLRLPPDQVAQTMHVMREEVSAFFHTLPSYVGNLVYGDPSTGSVISLTIWTDRSDQQRVSPADLIAYVSNRHNIEIVLLGVRYFDLLFEDQLVARVQSA